MVKTKLVLTEFYCLHSITAKKTNNIIDWDDIDKRTLKPKKGKKYNRVKNKMFKTKDRPKWCKLNNPSYKCHEDDCQHLSIVEPDLE